MDCPLDLNGNPVGPCVDQWHAPAGCVLNAGSPEAGAAPREIVKLNPTGLEDVASARFELEWGGFRQGQQGHQKGKGNKVEHFLIPFAF
ncbi:MAG: hypothetical protein HYR60_14035 [Acidobacteria bacterium]|nr:hypothetical protein [Acidobacteriota bacterium]